MEFVIVTNGIKKILYVKIVIVKKIVYFALKTVIAHLNFVTKQGKNQSITKKIKVYI